MLKPARLLTISALTISSGFFAFGIYSFTSTASPSMQSVAAKSAPTTNPPSDPLMELEAWTTAGAQVDQANAQLASELVAAHNAFQAYYAAQQPKYTPTVTSVSSSAPSGGGDWSAVATCEEGGRNDATYGYFGIMPGNWPPGESPANMSYAQQVALGDSLNGGSAPSEAGGCHGW